MPGTGDTDHEGATPRYSWWLVIVALSFGLISLICFGVLALDAAAILLQAASVVVVQGFDSAGFLLRIVDVTGTLALTSALAAIYIRQNSILEKQTNTLNEHSESLESQVRTMQRQSRPILKPKGQITLHRSEPELDEDDSSETEPENRRRGGHWVSVRVKNRGDDTAKNLRIVTLAYVDDEESDPMGSPPYPGRAIAEVSSSETTPLSGSVLEADEDASLVQAHPQFSKGSDGEGGFLPFCSQIDRLLDDRNGPVRFGFVLLYEDSVDKEWYVPLKSAYSMSPREYQDIEGRVEIEDLEASSDYDIEDLTRETGWKGKDRINKQ